MEIKLKNVNLFKGLSREKIKKIELLLHESEFAKGETVLCKGNICRNIFIVKSGKIKIFQKNELGREQLLEILMPGDTCACHMAKKKWSCAASAVTLTPCQVWSLSWQDYNKFIVSDPTIASSLNTLFYERLHHHRLLINEILLTDSKSRLIKYILDTDNVFQNRLSDFEDGNIPFSHGEISKQLGLSRGTISRHLLQLKRLGFIDTKFHNIVIKDMDGLKNYFSQQSSHQSSLQ